jgi:transposase
VDETRFWRREPWLTGFVDLDSGTLLDIVRGRTKASVTGWLDQLSAAQHEAITVVVTDPHAGYRSALTSTLSGVTAVVDRFHLAMLAGRVVTDVRRRRIWEQQDRRGPQLRRRVQPAGVDLARRSRSRRARPAAAALKLNSYAALGQLIREWRATAEVHADRRSDRGRNSSQGKASASADGL